MPESTRLPPLYALRAFESAARHASFTRAAQELSLTQSAISRHIRTLETHFGCRLFERSGRQLLLTEPAKLLLPGISEGFEALGRACSILSVDEGVLRLKAPSTLSLRWLLARLSRFRQANEGIEVQLTSAWMDYDFVDFLHEPFDCAVLLSDGRFPEDWESTLLFQEWLIPVCSPEAAAEGPWDVQRLRETELLHPTPDRRDWRRWLQVMSLSDDISIRGGQVFDTLELGMAAASRGYGVSIGDLIMVLEDLQLGRAALPWPSAVASGEAYYLVWPRARRNPKRFSLLRDFLLAEVNAMTLPNVTYHS
ncbi:LysR substrate-binding domain-containing protein [Pseudomonas asuensis]|uniref:Transcriptional regulator n=1 Tax=Pseudomonas asuensis TaxID=1825787 RepID=A0ABQ2GSQ2_9PSED|nr:LysR substrate-binding domain-containing protein [Pseudomonas asuensis]GGM09637.1 transcriptional regulator [Pseudomonas asuensis]